MIDIDKAFENRWRIKTNNPNDGGGMLLVLIKKNCPEFLDLIKNFCRDFFEAGICLGQGSKFDPIPMSAIVKAAEEVSFDYWWDLYDKKIDRGKCEKKWAKLTLAEKQACIDATPAYVASTPDLQFRRHPMTYLNNKSWENQIIPRSNGSDNKPTKQDPRDKLADILTD